LKKEIGSEMWVLIKIKNTKGKQKQRIINVFLRINEFYFDKNRLELEHI